MAYYVLGEQGQKYGPADVATLNLWIGEGRVVPQTMLEDEVSGGQIVATAVAGLKFPLAPPTSATSNYPRYAQAPGQQPYIPQMQTARPASADFGLALAMGLVSPILSFTISVGGITTALIGMRAAVKARQAGHPMGLLVIILNGIALALWLVARVIRWSH